MPPLFERCRALAAVATPALVAWSAPHFRGISLAELREVDPTVAVVRDPAGDTHGLQDAFVLSGAPFAASSRGLRARAVFTRHLQPVDTVVAVRFLEDVVAALAEARARLPLARVDLAGLPLAHVRRVVRESAPAAAEAGVPPPERPVISALVAGGWLHLGTSSSADMLSSWAGADPHRMPEAVSRAGAKLREALAHLEAPLPACPSVLDLGAAPGGFTSVLLELGARVLAIDPAPLAPALTGAPGLTFVRGYADSLDPGDVPALDLLTCDVVTNPAASAALVRPFAARLATGAPAIITVKLRAQRDTLSQLEGLAALFAPELELVRLRHLFANRIEVTGFFRRP